MTTYTTRVVRAEDRGRHAPRLSSMQVWTKLIVGLGALAALTVLAVVIGNSASVSAGQKMQRAGVLQVPAAVSASRAQADLRGMSGDLQAYLVLGQPEYRESYSRSAAAVAADLAALNGLSQGLGTGDRQHVSDLMAAFDRWSKLPDRLFAIHDNRVDREPAFRLLSADALPLAGVVLSESNKLIDTLSRGEPSPGNAAVLADAARFQTTFGATVSSLQAYVGTRDPGFRDEFLANLGANNSSWDALYSQRPSLSPGQQSILDQMSAGRQAFVKMPDQILEILASDQWRQDLYVYRNEAAPLASQMLGILDEIETGQRNSLQSGLGQGSATLTNSRWAALAVGLVAILFGLGMYFFLRQSIGGPIRRLTRVAEQVQSGDLTAQAVVESHDEIGTLAETFNRMTRYLRRTLLQTRREKKRADDLLNVVIPLGMQLTAEKDLSRLLENIVIQAQTFCHATCGVLYLRSDAGHLEPIVVRDDAAGLALGGTTGRPVAYEPIPLDDPMYSLTVRAAWFGTTVNVPDAVPSGALNYVSPAFVENPYENNTSFLAIPLRPSQGQVMGVLQLTGAQDPDTLQIVPFDSHLQQMMDSFSLLAAAALEAYLREQGLREQIQQLRIEIDEVKRQQQVKEIVGSDFFQDLQAKARSVRSRNARTEEPKPPASADNPQQNSAPMASAPSS